MTPTIQTPALHTGLHHDQRGGMCRFEWHITGDDVFHWYCRNNGMVEVHFGFNGPFEGYLKWDESKDGPIGFAAVNPVWLHENGYKVYEELSDLPNATEALHRYAAAHLHKLTELIDQNLECLIPQTA